MACMAAEGKAMCVEEKKAGSGEAWHGETTAKAAVWRVAEYYSLIWIFVIRLSHSAAEKYRCSLFLLSTSLSSLTPFSLVSVSMTSSVKKAKAARRRKKKKNKTGITSVSSFKPGSMSLSVLSFSQSLYVSIPSLLSSAMTSQFLEEREREENISLSNSLS